MVLKYIYCLECERVTPDVDVGSMHWDGDTRRCEKCSKATRHEVYINYGGPKYRYNDGWNDHDYAARCSEYTGVGAGTQDDNGITFSDYEDADGNMVGDADRFSKEAIQERREEQNFERKQSEGTNPLHF